jgi:hypothetical protein
MTIRTALAAATLALIAGTAHAQDIAGWYNGVVADQNAMMNGVLGNIVSANAADPYIQQLYIQQVNAGLFYGSIEEFAYKYAATGGMSQAGYNNLMASRNEVWGQMQTQNQGFMAAPQVYQDAYGNWVQGYANNQGQMAALWGGY